MKYLFAFLAALMLSACSESPEESPAASADATHAHDGEAHGHEGAADHNHESTETEVFYGDQAESVSEVGTVGGPSVTGLDHEHDESADHHHEEVNTGEHSNSEDADHHHDESGEDHHH